MRLKEQDFSISLHLPTSFLDEHKEIVTVTEPAVPPSSYCMKTPFTAKQNKVKHAPKDKFLSEKVKSGAKKSTVLWLPENGRKVDLNEDNYRRFTHVMRVLHVHDAVHVWKTQQIPPKNIITYSHIHPTKLEKTHPCKNLKVLWFSAMFPTADLDEHDWYGNIEFSFSIDHAARIFKNYYLVEMMSAPTHTISRILMTNKDYSSVLTVYDPTKKGGPWFSNSDGNFTLIKCARFQNQGINRHDHCLEFLLEVAGGNETEILQNSEVSFKNHDEAKDMTKSHVCNRYQRRHTNCPSPLDRTTSAKYFYKACNPSLPKLSDQASQLIKSFQVDSA